MTTIVQSAQALLGLINDILDFSKIEARKLALEQIPFALRDTVEDAMKTLAIRAQQRGLELASHIRSQVPDRLIGDPGRLKQILTNLVANALKFTEQGEVVVSVDTASLDQNAVVLHFAVSDTGIGIPEDKRAVIFEAFSQADSSTTRRFGGTGLGLSIASQLVSLLGGTMWLDSEVGTGSTFHFTARFARPIADAAEAVVPALDLHNLRVLIVDDNATNRRILHEVLVNWKMKPDAVASGADGLAALKEARKAGRPYALVIIDGHMPQMDGFMFASRVRRDRQLRATPLVMLTSAALSDDPARCRKLGIDGHLTKPVKQSDLLDTILSVFGGRAQRGAHAVDSLDRTAAQPLRVLVAEDNHVNRQFVTRVLEKRGHSVATAVNGRQAIDAIAAAPPGHFDVVLMDVQMPEVDGLSATVLIRQRERSRRRAHPDRRDDRSRDVGRSRALSGVRHGRLHLEAVASARARGGRRTSGRVTTGSAGGAAACRHVGRRSCSTWSSACSRLGGDRQLLREVIVIFRAESLTLLARIRGRGQPTR